MNISPNNSTKPVSRGQNTPISSQQDRRLSKLSLSILQAASTSTLPAGQSASDRVPPTSFEKSNCVNLSKSEQKTIDDFARLNNRCKEINSNILSTHKSGNDWQIRQMSQLVQETPRFIKAAATLRQKYGADRINSLLMSKGIWQDPQEDVSEQPVQKLFEKNLQALSRGERRHALNQIPQQFVVGLREADLPDVRHRLAHHHPVVARKLPSTRH